MVRLSVDLDVLALKRTLNELEKKRVPKAAGIALGRVGTTVRKVASMSIRERMAISAAVAKKAITLRRVGQTRLTLFVEASGRPIPIRDFQAKEGKRGVSYRISKGAGKKIYANKFGKGFIVPRIGGHVFVRVTPDPPGKPRANIRLAYGPSVPQYFVTRHIRELMERSARERWPIEFARAWRGLSIRQ